MSLLAPLFLLGLAAAAVPVLIHLRLRNRSRVVRFPSLMFISKAPYRAVRRRRLRDVLLLLLRCLAVVLLALAFARPLWRGDGGAAAAAASDRLAVVLLDRSFSMGYGDRWQRAVQAAESVFAGLEAADRGALIAYSDEAELQGEPTSDRTLLAAMVQDVEVTPRATSLLPALQMARGVLAEAGDIGRRELVIVSDFQRSSWSPDHAALLPDGVEPRLVDVAAEDEEVGNAAVTDVAFDHSRSGAREQVAVAARISYKVVPGPSADPAAGAPLPVKVDLLLGRDVVQTRAVDLAVDSSTTVSFAPEVLERGRTTRGTVRLRDDALAADNEHRFVLSPAHEVGVLVIGPDGDRRRGRYLEEALALGRRPFFRVDRVQASGFQRSMLDDKSVVVVNDSAQQLSAAAGSAVADFVRDGGGLLLAVERGLSATAFLLGDLGVVSEEQVDRLSGSAGSLAWFDTGHPVFDLFAAARSGDFSSASFFRYHRLAPPPGAAAIARFDDGSPALLDLQPGAVEGAASSDRASGRVLVLPTSFDAFWNTLPLQAVFLPFVHRSVEYLAGYSLPRSWYRVGEVAQVELPGGQAVDEGNGYVSVAPSGRETRIEADRGGLLLDVEEPGFYEFRKVRADVAAEPLILAANVPVAESDLSRLDPDEFRSRIRAGTGTGADGQASAAAAQTPEEREGRQRLWWFLIVAAALILAGETLFGNRRRPAAAPVVTAWSSTGNQEAR